MTSQSLQFLCASVFDSLFGWGSNIRTSPFFLAHFLGLQLLVRWGMQGESDFMTSSFKDECTSRIPCTLWQNASTTSSEQVIYPGRISNNSID